LRLQKGLSLDKLADLTGMSKSYLWELENRDRGNPSAEKLSKIAEELGVTSEFLLNPELEEPNEEDLRKAFFRKFDRLDPSTKRVVKDIIDRWGGLNEKDSPNT
jgi:transcriptional regulator with XRE-family HTH domain